MRDHRPLRISPVTGHAAGAFEEVTTYMMTFHTGRINGRVILFLNEVYTSSEIGDGNEKFFECCFFKKRACAFCNVV